MSGSTGGGRCTPACPAGVAPAGSARGVRHRRAQPADRSQATEVGRRGGDVGAGAQRPQIEVRVVPAHPVEQLGEFGRGPGGHEELCAPGRRGGHRPERQPHPLQPHQRTAPGRFGDIQDVEGAADGEQHRGAGDLGPGASRDVERGAGRDLLGEVQRVCAGGGADRVAARARARGGPRARRHRPAPESCVLGHRRALGRTAAAPRAGSHLTDAADREAHAPSNGSDSPVVTTRRHRSAVRVVVDPSSCGCFRG